MVTLKNVSLFYVKFDSRSFIFYINNAILKPTYVERLDGKNEVKLQK